MRLTKPQQTALQLIKTNTVQILADRVARPLLIHGLIKTADVQSVEPGTWYCLTAKGMAQL